MLHTGNLDPIISMHYSAPLVLHSKRWSHSRGSTHAGGENCSMLPPIITSLPCTTCCLTFCCPGMTIAGTLKYLHCLTSAMKLYILHISLLFNWPVDSTIWAITSYNVSIYSLCHLHLASLLGHFNPWIWWHCCLEIQESCYLVVEHHVLQKLNPHSGLNFMFGMGYLCI
jgi:hypothetical protein